MLARALRPAHRLIPITAIGVVVLTALALAMPHAAWLDAGLRRGGVAALLVGLLGLAHARLALALGGSVLAGGLCCWLAGQPTASAALMLVLAGCAVPTALLWERRSPTRADAALGLSGMLIQAALVSALPAGWAVVLGLVVGGTLGLLAPGVVAGQSSSAATDVGMGPAQPLTPLPQPNLVLQLVPKAALAAVLATLVLLHPALPGAHQTTLWIALAALVVLWMMVTGSAVVAALMVACQLLALGLATTLPGGDDLLLGVLAPAQIMPLTVRWWWFWRPSLLKAVLVAAWLPGLVLGQHPAVVLLGGVGATLAMAPWPVRWRRPASSAAQAIRAARGVLSIYWAWYLPMKLRLDPMFAQLAADRRPWGRVLDVGCGPGLGALLAVTRPGTTAYCGIDLDEEKLVVARHLLAASRHPLSPTRRLILGRMPFAEPLREDSDTVLLLDVLHYWPPEEQRRLLRQLRDACSMGGELWLREGCADANGSAGRVAGGERFTTFFALNPGVATLHFQTREGLEGWLREAGWAVVETQASGAENRLWRLRAVEALAGGA